MLNLRVALLSAASFAPFGEVIEAVPQQTSFAINAGTSQRFHDLARLDPGADGRLIVSIFQAEPRAMPFTVRMLERHPLGSQAFMPLDGRPFLVVVAPAGEQPESASIRAFISNGRQGVNFSAGVWHHPLLALHLESRFLVIDRDGPGGNCEEYLLPEPCLLDLTHTGETIQC